MGGTHPSFRPLHQQQSEMIKDYIKKIPTFIAFFKLLLGHVKVEIMLMLVGASRSPPPTWAACTLPPIHSIYIKVI